MDLKDRVALVTGGGTGLGRAISLALAQAGCDVAINYSRSEQEAEETAEAVRKLGRQACALRANVATDAEARRLVDETVQQLGGLDVLINNAGTTRYVPIEDLEGISEEDWDRIMAVNLKGSFLCARAAAPHLRRRGRGKIVNISSTSAFTTTGSSIPYMASKAGLVVLTRTLARALAPEIQVNAAAPGWLATRWADEHLPPEERERLFASPTFPTAQPEEVAETVIFLLRVDSITGQTIVVDSGTTLR
jgi:3-oxoacyl-[acyl-carrier protein] reductase